jgi:hypothetical protein
VTNLEIVEILTSAGITEGYAIRNGLIVVWENKTAIPEELAQFIQLDEQA